MHSLFITRALHGCFGDTFQICAQALTFLVSELAYLFTHPRFFYKEVD